MKISTLLITTLILGVFQLVFLEYFRIFGVKPDLLLAIVVIAGLFLETRWAVVFGASVGVFKDIFSLGPFGLQVILFSLWGFLVVKISRKISIEDNIAVIPLILIITLLQNIFMGLALIYSGSPAPVGIFFRIVIIGSLYTALISPLILKLTKARI